jgi:predicted nucleic acid-binding Zn ribbon protein
VTEVIHSMIESGPAVCERCGGELRRVIYPAGIIFKGSGFYRNDSRGSDTSSDGGSSTSGSGSSGGDAPSKPATSETTTGSAPAGDGGKKERKKIGDAPST